jgi:hypothetical protein
MRVPSIAAPDSPALSAFDQRGLSCRVGVPVIQKSLSTQDADNIQSSTYYQLTAVREMTNVDALAQTKHSPISRYRGLGKALSYLNDSQPFDHHSF